MAQHNSKFSDWFVAFGLTLLLHLAILLIAMMPLGNYFFPFIDGIGGGLERYGYAASSPPDEGQSFSPEVAAIPAGPDIEAASAPYRFTKEMHQIFSAADLPASGHRPMLASFFVDSPATRSLSRSQAPVRLQPPDFSPRTIPPKPAKSLQQELVESASVYLEGDIFEDSVPATISGDELNRRESSFVQKVHEDIMDGHLDMDFADFIIPAEYYQLSRALLAQGRQPAFSLDDAFGIYHDRLAKVAEDLPPQIDAYALVMILQRYAENKYYPGNGSGMLLDSLFHNLNDCEGGTKEVLAYLDAIYPQLTLGSNRGMIPTTTGEIIGHMQVYLGSDAATQGIIANDQGVVVETTRVARNSILPYVSGDIYPLEDFIYRYYPAAIEGTPLARFYQDGGYGQPDSRRVVGTSDHPLKKGYGATGTMLTSQFFDLENIRTRRIENEFLRSDLPSCDPNIDPLAIDRSNVFSNFVDINRNLRGSLINHYLADLVYWNNQLMPMWKKPEFLATYDDLAKTLMGEDSSSFIAVDDETSINSAQVASHRRFLRYIRAIDAEQPGSYLGSGVSECRWPALLDDRLLTFLFKVPTGPGLFFLPPMGEDFSWPHLLEAILDDCMVMPAAPETNTLLPILAAEAAGQRASFRKELYNRARMRGLAPFAVDDRLDQRIAALEMILGGHQGTGETVSVLAGRKSAASTVMDPSVAETLEESGRSGINSGLLWDGFDFIGPRAMQVLLRQYGSRPEIRLSVDRAAGLIGNLATIIAERLPDMTAIGDYLSGVVTGNSDPHLRLVTIMAVAELQDRPPREISRTVAAALAQGGRLHFETIRGLLRYGLLADDAMDLYHQRLRGLLTAMPGLQPAGNTLDRDNELFAELVDLIRLAAHFQDTGTGEQLASTLRAGIRNDLAFDRANRHLNGNSFDYGILFTKFSLLAMLKAMMPEVMESDDGVQAFVTDLVDYASNSPFGKLLLSLVLRTVDDQRLRQIVQELVAGQLESLRRLSLQDATGGEIDTGTRGQAVAGILGHGNSIVRLLEQADTSLAAALAGVDQERMGTVPGARSRWYLERLHGTAAEAMAPLIGADDSGQEFPASFYNDPRVRESFSLLAWAQGEKAQQQRVKFRTIKDLRAITNFDSLKVITGERKITRQDISLLTLALNPANQPEQIRSSWEDSLAVVAGHLALNPGRASQREYLFSPHAPYLVENDAGFFYSPEIVADLHNAAEWGGRNDILLSSYLHFEHLPDRLPDWLLATALKRSEFELDIIEKFSRETFLPMILECTDDQKRMPGALFTAKWESRKPFGEDIFPATLLLLRMGYMEVTADGEIVRTDK